MAAAHRGSLFERIREDSWADSLAYELARIASNEEEGMNRGRRSSFPAREVLRPPRWCSRTRCPEMIFCLRNRLVIRHRFLLFVFGEARDNILKSKHYFLMAHRKKSITDRERKLTAV